MQVEWNADSLSELDAHVMDFGNMLWDVDTFDNAEAIRLLSPSDIPVPHSKSALLESCGSDIALDATAEALVVAPPIQTSNDCRIQEPAIEGLPR